MNIRDFFNKNKMLTLVMATLLIWVLFHILTGQNYLTARNISNLFRQMAITGVLATGMMFVIINGEIDLSVGSSLGLLGGIGAMMNVWFGMPVWVVLISVFALGILIGAFNGYWVAYAKIPSFIVTLAGMLAFRGILLGFTKGQTISPIDPGFSYLGNGYINHTLSLIIAVVVAVLFIISTFSKRNGRIKYGLPVSDMKMDIIKCVCVSAVMLGMVLIFNLRQGMPFPVFILLVLLIGLTFMADRTVFGRRIYAIGSNREATRMSGVDVDKIKMFVFMLMGATAAIAGLLTTARLGAGDAAAGNMGELDAIASCFIGGASMRGGVGTVAGALIGALIMASLDNGMSMMGLDSFWQMIVKGSVLLLAVFIDVATSNKAA